MKLTSNFEIFWFLPLRNFIGKRRLLFSIFSAIITQAIFAYSAAAKTKTKIVFWHSTHDVVGRQNVIDLVSSFNQSQSEIEVIEKLVAGTSDADLTDVTKLIVATASGNAPDIYLMDRFTVAERASLLLLEDLTPFIKKFAPNLPDEHIPYSLKEVTYKGKIYGIPTNTDSRALYFRTDILQEAGVKVEEVINDHKPMKLADFVSLAAKFDKKDKSGEWERVGFNPWAGQGNFFTWALIHDARVFDTLVDKSGCEVTPEKSSVQEAMEFMSDYIESKGADLLRRFIARVSPENLPGSSQPFVAGKIPFLIEGSWHMATLKVVEPNLKWDVTYLPTLDGGKRSWAGGWSIVMPRGGRNKEAAFRFMTYFAGKDGQAAQMKVGRLPTNRGLIQSQKDFFAKYLEFSSPRPAVPTGASYWKELAQLQSDVVAGSLPKSAIADRLKSVKEEINKKLARYCSQKSN